MTPQRHAQIGALFAAALSIDLPAEREAFLADVTKNDPDLLNQVQQLLAHHHDTDAFLTINPIHSRPRFIAQYQILEPLGEGAMGAVYRARHTQIPGPDVAIKLIRPNANGQNIASRFRSEQRLLSRLNHPNIAKIYDSAPDYIAMELVSGLPLNHFCQQNNPSLTQRLQLLITICQAVQHAHYHGVLHRDLKPSNILVTPEGQPKIIDFGLAKAIGGETDFTTLTQLGTILGTFQYMSPEQAKPSETGITEASDIFSLGAILYELLFGHPPLSTASLQNQPYTEVLHRVLHEIPSPPTTGFPALNQITAKALAKQPQDRYRSAAELARALEELLQSGGAGNQSYFR
jgi:serine/threonine protein kinase